MGTTLDGQNLFDEQYLDIEVGSLSRDSIESSIAGLDGIISIDLGNRSRQIKQKGVLRAISQNQLEARITAISSILDGKVHTLVTSSGKTFDNLRLDFFKVTKKQVSGNGVVCNYEIIYKQLMV